MAYYPEYPRLIGLDIARPHHILRCAMVAYAGFEGSPVFDWERPKHHEYPQDTLASYMHQVQELMKRDDVIVLVCADQYRSLESESVGIPGSGIRRIYHNSGWQQPEEGRLVVVGWAAIIFKPGSKRNGQFANRHGERRHSVISLNMLIAQH